MENTETYFSEIKEKISKAYEVGNKARAEGKDPDIEVESIPAGDLAIRVEGLVGPKGIASMIKEVGRESIAKIITEILGDISSLNRDELEERTEQAIRTSLAIITEGVVAAPIEGISKVKIQSNPDGSSYLTIYFAGPIRSAGGTAQGVTAVFGDYIQKLIGLQGYRPTQDEIERYVEEIKIYNDRVSRLQYLPSDDEIREIIKNLPICINGDPTEEREVSIHRDIQGVETNRIRGGMCLVIAEGIAQKASKVMTYASSLDLDWSWLRTIGKGKETKEADKRTHKLFMSEIVGGRPIFSAPSEKGGFRLRYGRSRCSGIAAKSIHPVLQILSDGFIATGTQLKIEQPGKACVITPCEALEGPIVKVKDGSVLRVETVEKAKEIKSDIKEILFLGDLLISYGDFLQTNTPLLPTGYCEEFWIQELKQKTDKIPKEMPTANEAVKISQEFNVPLHPRYTYHWEDLNVGEIRKLVEWLFSGELRNKFFVLKNNNEEAKRILEFLGVPHLVKDGKIFIEEYVSLLLPLGIYENGKTKKGLFIEKLKKFQPKDNAFEFIQETSPIKIRKKVGVYIGARMGRPEKAKERKLSPPVHSLFPVGMAGGKERNINLAAERNSISLEVSRFECPKCGSKSILPICPKCGEKTILRRVCPSCNTISNEEICPKCKSRTSYYETQDVDIKTLWKNAVEKVGYEEVKGVIGLISSYKIPEPLEKGILRAKHNVFVFKDGTIRYDATNVPLTQFKPKEINVGIEKLKYLGYKKDVNGRDLEREDQILELKVQDVIVPEEALEYLFRVSKFIDKELEKFYLSEKFYNLKRKEELLGELVVGLAPHTSAGIIGRIIGTSKANVCFAHPFWHAAKRRNCFHGDETLLVYNNDNKEFTLVTIKDLVESNLIGKTEKDDFGTEYKKITGLKTFAFNKNSKKFELVEITHVSKHLAPKKLIELKTKSGRKIITTFEHSFPDRSGSKIKAENAKELLIPWKIKREPIIEKENMSLLSITDNSDIMIRTEEDVFDEETPFLDISKELGISYKTFTNYIYRKSYPIDIVKKFNPNIIDNENYLLGSKRDKTSIKPNIALNNDFFELLGFYLAEGYTKKNQKESYQISITATKKWVKKLIKEKIKNIFGLDVSVSKNQVTICSRFVYELFESLKIGNCAKTKRISNFIYSLPIERVKAFLRGYFSGDGSCSLYSSLEVNVTSVNKWLIDGVSFLLMFCGIKHAIYEEKRMIKSNLILNFYGKPKEIHSYKIRIYGTEAKKFIEKIGFLNEKQKKAEVLLKKWIAKKGQSKTKFEGDVFIDKIVEKKLIDNKEKYVYNLTVDKHHNLICSGITTFQCDGDEDSIMLLLDVLLNFSRKYLPEKRGGKMDAPLVISTILDPKEIDDEAHKMEIIDEYPLDFYLLSLERKNPDEVDVGIVKNILDKEPYSNLKFTHSTNDIIGAVFESRYVKLKTMQEKVESQLKVAERIRAVDEKEVAELVINSHFLRDAYGNLRAFSRQKFRCVKCNKIYRRIPLIGKCTKCGGKLLLTVPEGAVRKYIDISLKLSEKYHVSAYIKQRLMLLEREINSLFTNDLSKQLGLGDYI